jgi:outer membrane protein
MHLHSADCESLHLDAAPRDEEVRSRLIGRWIYRAVAFVATALLLWMGAFSVAAPAEQPTESAELLTVDQAVQIALANNRNLKIVSLSLDSSKEKLAAEKTRRLPSFNTYIFASQLLQPINFTVQAGQFGTYPGIGPIPATNTNITTPSQPTAYIFGTASQPLLTLYKINIHIHGQELSVEQAVQKLREERISVVDDVRQAYYSIVEIQNAIDATDASIKQYKELDRISTQYVAEQVVLKSESLEVKAKLADEEFKLLQYQDKLASAKETLNNLLGRDINTQFSAVNPTELSAAEENLPAAQALALAQNPKVKEAEITVKQADNVRRQVKAQYLPDLGASFHYLSPFGVNFVPTNVMGLGIEFNWEPFDWNRRKHEVNEKVIAVEQSKLSLDDTKAQVLINLDTQFRSLHEARVAVAVATAKKEASTEKLREVTEKFQQKTVLLRDVLQQQSAVEASNADYNEAMAKFWTAKANFQKAIGEE